MDANDCLSLFRQLPDGAPFRYLKGLTASDIFLDSNESENDTLNIGYYAIMKTREEVPCIGGTRTAPLFTVFETVMIPGSHWEPDDADIMEFTQRSAFYDALREIVLREVDNYVRNIQESDALTSAYSEE
jgi:hypothetical protein